MVPMPAEDEIEEAFIEIRHLASKKLVTIIEVVSPANKVRGSNGRASFLKKRQEALTSKVHWVEIDLLRGARRLSRFRWERTATIASWYVAATSQPRPSSGRSACASHCRSSPFRCASPTPTCRSISASFYRPVTSMRVMTCRSIIARSPTRR